VASEVEEELEELLMGLRELQRSHTTEVQVEE
jgi:hypothetical protein